MNERLRQLRERLTQLVTEARQVLDRAAGENRELTQEENNRYDQFFSDIETTKRAIQREEALAAEERHLAEPAPTHAGGRDGPEPPEGRSANAAVHPIWQRGQEYLRAQGFMPEPEESAQPR